MDIDRRCYFAFRAWVPWNLVAKVYSRTEFVLAARLCAERHADKYSKGYIPELQDRPPE
jgi:hypothetical protein